MISSTEIKMANVRAVSVLFGDLLRTAAQETAFQIALGNSSEEAKGEVNIYLMLEKGYRQSNTSW